MQYDPKFFTSRDVGGGGKAKCKGKDTSPAYMGEEKGDILIRYLWTQETNIIHYMRVVNTDTVSYQSNNPDNCL